MNEDDVTENEILPSPANSRGASSPLNEWPSEDKKENDVTTDLEDAPNVSDGGVDITLTGISKKENSGENMSPRGRNYNLRPNPTPNYTEE